MCECSKEIPCTCPDRVQKEFEAGQCWLTRNGEKRWIVGINPNNCDYPVVVTKNNGLTSNRQMNGRISPHKEDEHDLVSLYVEPKTYEVNVYVYEYDAGRISYGAYTPEFAEKISAHKSTYLKAIKKLKIAEGEGL